MSRLRLAAKVSGYVAAVSVKAYQTVHKAT
jgi:multidrug resistance efflux pump